jgi:hypothetical protein
MGMGQLWQDSQDMASGTGLLRLDSRERSTRWLSLTGQPGQVSLGRTERTSLDMTATTR